MLASPLSSMSVPKVAHQVPSTPYMMFYIPLLPKKLPQEILSTACTCSALDVGVNVHLNPSSVTTLKHKSSTLYVSFLFEDFSAVFYAPATMKSHHEL